MQFSNHSAGLAMTETREWKISNTGTGDSVDQEKLQSIGASAIAKAAGTDHTTIKFLTAA